MPLPKLPETETLNVTEARRLFSENLDRVRRREARIVVEKSGIPVGAIVSMDDLARLRQVDRDRVRLLELMDEIATGFEGIPETEIEAEVERAIAEVEANRRARREAAAKRSS
jgi:prevent-host-death family protein